MLVASLQVKNLPVELHEELRRRALAERTTVSNYVVELLRRELAIPTWGRWLSTIGERAPVAAPGVDAALEAERAAHDNDLGGRHRRD